MAVDLRSALDPKKPHLGAAARSAVQRSSTDLSAGTGAWSTVKAGWTLLFNTCAELFSTLFNSQSGSLLHGQAHRRCIFNLGHLRSGDAVQKVTLRGKGCAVQQVRCSGKHLRHDALPQSGPTDPIRPSGVSENASPGRSATLPWMKSRPLS